MMDFSLDKTESMSLETAAAFAKTLREQQRKAEREGISSKVQQTWDEIGFAALDWPETLGGSAQSMFLKTQVAETLAYGCAGQWLALDRTAAAMYAVAALPKSNFKTKLEERLVQQGHALEPVVFIDLDDCMSMNAGRIDGTIPYVPAHAPRLLFVLQGSNLAVVDSGILSTPILPCGLEAAGGVELAVNTKADVFELTPDAMDLLVARLRLITAAALTGVARASLDYAFEYTQNREAFGRKIAHHQAIAFMLADMKIAIDATHVLITQASWEIAQNSGALAAASALVQAVETALKLTVDGVQLLGGHGFVKDHPAEKWMRDARTLASLFGGRTGAEIDLETRGAHAWHFAA